ncbi:tRNA N6-adenosine threonylcarbamoyltransferase [Chaetomidium leptoderma]|uniref:N(6)-L-threonylcarbamoyladenine synthase n=1 Tax=Chaetomidium leptoderma TaxID=669021 RepID=A0AAN6VNR5_9PEZI|nr:tRNA N6-adenosine threonylcarbamoyltransferase [Chaetomidium leptoderma]
MRRATAAGPLQWTRRPHLCQRVQVLLRSGYARYCNKPAAHSQAKPLLTLAIETSCDDTCVAVLEKHGNAARLLFNQKITSDNRKFGGVEPVTAAESHTANVAPLVQAAVRALPRGDWRGISDCPPESDEMLAFRRKPDFISVTRGPGMASSLSVGLTMAKGLAVAWQVPLVAVHHMQAHALTPRMVNALEHTLPQPNPEYPFMSLLVSGGHTQLLLSRSVTSHSILAEAKNIAIGDMLDKCARAILPADVIAQAGDVMYGALLETFAFPPSDPAPSSSIDPSIIKDPYKLTPPLPDTTTTTSSSSSSRDQYEAAAAQQQKHGYIYTAPARRADEIKPYCSPTYGWILTPPLADRREMAYDFSGFGGQVQRIMQQNPAMDVPQRRALARETMRIAFEHLASRIIFALDDLCGAREKAAAAAAATQLELQIQHHQTIQPELEGTQKPNTGPLLVVVETLVVSGGVASNSFLALVLREMLRVRGHGPETLRVVRPPARLCTDNAAMIAWAGMEMYEAGWVSRVDVLPQRKWAMDDAVVVGNNNGDRSSGGGVVVVAGGEGEDEGMKGGILGVSGWESRWAPHIS